MEISSTGILHLNNAYVYYGNRLDLNGLFSFSDVAEETVSFRKEIMFQIKNLQNIISWDTKPNIRPSKHCMTPYTCEFWEHCTSDMPEYWVMGLTEITQDKFEQLVELGVEEISEIPDEFPYKRDQLLDDLDRFKGLYTLIRKHYYHPQFYGSFSLKQVLPVLIPSMNHGSLNIQEGSMASIEYLRMLNPTTPPDEKAKIKHDLLAYFSYDTLGMLKIKDELISRLKQ